MPLGVLAIIVLLGMALRLIYVELDRHRLRKQLESLKLDNADLSNAIVRQDEDSIPPAARLRKPARGAE